MGQHFDQAKRDDTFWHMQNILKGSVWPNEDKVCHYQTWVIDPSILGPSTVIITQGA